MEKFIFTYRGIGKALPCVVKVVDTDINNAADIILKFLIDNQLGHEMIYKDTTFKRHPRPYTMQRLIKNITSKPFSGLGIVHASNGDY